MSDTERTRSFNIELDKLIKNNVITYEEVRDAIELYFLDSKSVNFHYLKGKMQNLGAFSVNEDIRVIVEITSEKTKFLFIGSHKDIYYR